MRVSREGRIQSRSGVTRAIYCPMGSPTSLAFKSRPRSKATKRQPNPTPTTDDRIKADQLRAYQRECFHAATVFEATTVTNVLQSHIVLTKKTGNISRSLAVSSSLSIRVMLKQCTLLTFQEPTNEYLGGKAKSLAHSSAVNADFVPPDRLFLPTL